jgi:hypothetical protein
MMPMIAVIPNSPRMLKTNAATTMPGVFPDAGPGGGGATAIESGPLVIGASIFSYDFGAKCVDMESGGRGTGLVSVPIIHLLATGIR